MPESIRSLQQLLSPSLTASLADIWLGSSLHLVSAVWWQNTHPWCLPTRCCPDTFLLIPVSGHFECELTSKSAATYRVGPGQALLLPPDTSHRLRIGRATSKLEQVSIHFHLSDALGLNVAHNLTHPVCDLPGDIASPRRLERVVALAGPQPESAQAMLSAIVAGILEEAALAGRLRSQLRAVDDPRITRALRFLRANLEHDISVEDLARQAALGPVRFRQLFQAATGSTPRHFLVRARLAEAANQLRRTSEPVASIAARCGFPTEGHFYATFRREYGLTPRQWRKQGVDTPQQSL